MPKRTSTLESPIQTWLQIQDATPSAGSTDYSYGGQDAYCGWDVLGAGAAINPNGSVASTNDLLGCGPMPAVDGQAMISWWLNRATPITNWLSGSPLTVVDPLGGYTNGTPGLHFYEWQFADGSTNTFVWADEQITVTTNFGVGLTDIFSNEWTGPIGIEPVIAWRWHGP